MEAGSACGFVSAVLVRKVSLEITTGVIIKYLAKMIGFAYVFLCNK
jgi:hypothetical protein